MRAVAPLLLAAVVACSPSSTGAPDAGDADDTGPQANDDAGAPGGDDGGAASGDDAGAAGDDAGAAGGDDAGAAGSDDAGAPPPDDAGTATSGYGPYDVDGAEAFTTSTLNVGDYSLDVYLPSTAGPRPVVSLSPGLLQPASAYTTIAERMASHGIAVFIRSDPGIFTETTSVTADIEDLISTVLPAENADSNSDLYGRLDLSKVGLAGHSRGGKASLIAAEHGTGDAWFGLDPVDASEWSGGVQARDALDDLAIPTVYLGAEISSSCSPAGDQYGALYPGSPSPSVQLVGVGCGHTQLEDQDHCTGCEACSPGGTADDEVVIRYTRRYVTAFFARELLGDASVGATFDGAGASLDIADGLIERSSK